MAHRRDRWTEVELETVRRAFISDGPQALATRMDRTAGGIRDMAARLGMYRSKNGYVVNDAFFDTWSPEMAYVLGFVLADGCLTSQGHLKIGIIDGDLLLAIRDAMGSTHPIKESWDARSPRPMYTLTIRRTRIIAALTRLGITPRKTYDATWPESPSECFPHLFRGYFDGDGSVGIAMNKHYGSRMHVSFTGASEPLLSGLRQRLIDAGVVRGALIERKGRRGNYILRYGSRSSRALYELMYPTTHVSLFLSRKKERFEAYINTVPMRGVAKASI